MNALDLIYLGVAIGTAPRWRRKARGGWPQRFGRIENVPHRGDDAGRRRPRLLLHAVSVGEVNALRWLVPLLAPDAHIIVSATTDTGLARAEELFAGACDVRRFPLDASWAVRRVLDAVRPDAVGLVELELWPNFMKACRGRGIPVAVISGRLSERSFRGYRKLRPLIRPMFAQLAAVGAQDEAYAERFAAMGVRPDRLSVTGSTKWDVAPPADDGRAAALAEAMGIDRARPLVVAGSTGPGEEALLHESVAPGVQLLCAPRKPERFEEAAAAMPGCARRSGGQRGAPGTDRFLLDTLGELGAAYALADVVVVGRSFGDLFGSDPIEPAALGRPILIGPAYGDFQQAVEALRAAGALIVTGHDRVGRDLAGLLEDPARRSAMGEAGRRAVAERRGASARHAEMLRRLLRSGSDCVQ
ncbi:MAG: 3-deoxy-D-manno-octulosonic acid transferase [Phycisphaerales bacterium JB039]